MIRHAFAALAASAAAFIAAAPTAAQDDAAYYGGVRFMVAPEDQARLNEIVTTYYVPIQDVLADNVIQFFETDGSGAWAFFGPFDTPEEALAAANWRDHPAWRAALAAEAGDEADAIVAEHLDLLNVQERFAASLRTTEGARMASDADAGAYYVARATAFAEGSEADAQDLITTYFAPADVAIGLEVIEFLGVDTEWDNLIFAGPLETADAAAAVIRGDEEGAFIGAIADIAGGADEATELLEEFDALIETDQVGAVTRGGPPQ